MGRTPGAKNKPKDQAMPTKTAERTTELKQYDEEAPATGAVAVFAPLRMPYDDRIKEGFGLSITQWKVLTEAIFPAAKSIDAVVMALSYCKTRGLDPFKRPVHIVPMWDSARGAMVETVWPGISELRTTASRTKGYAGCDVAEFGPTKKKEFVGRIKVKGNWEEAKVSVEFPEWCRITLYRVVDGQRCKFVGPKVSWLETYATQGGASDLPNKMWQERPEGQLEKCAEAAALRRAFPEEIGNELTAEEMTGRSVHDMTVEAPTATEHAASKDTAPPRQAPQQTDPEQEEARDGTPPARPTKDAAPPRQAVPKKADPISTGPQPKKEAGPTAKTMEPFKIPGAGESYESWTEKYIDNIKTAPDLATIYKWIDVNADPLGRLAKGKPSEYHKAKTTATEIIEKYREAQEKAKTKAKPAPKAEASDMEEHAGMDAGEMEPGEQEFGAPADDNPETILKWIDKTLSDITTPEDLEVIWERECQKYTIDMIPPDQDEAAALLRKHEKRLEP